MQKYFPNIKLNVMLLMLFLFIFSEAYAGVIFIGNQNSVPDELTAKDIESIFLGKRKVWKDNSPIKLVILKKTEPFSEFSRKYTGKPKHLYKGYWKRRVFTGKGEAPKGFNSEMQVINYVKQTEGAIGYVSSGVIIEDVKIISIIGRGGQK